MSRSPNTTAATTLVLPESDATVRNSAHGAKADVHFQGYLTVAPGGPTPDLRPRIQLSLEFALCVSIYAEPALFDAQALTDEVAASALGFA